jgi:hypothetical protein
MHAGGELAERETATGQPTHPHLIHGSVDWRDMPRLDIDSERIYEMKGHLTALRAHEAKLDVELSELQSAKKRSADMKRVETKRDAVRAEIDTVESELDATVNAPVSGGRDPTEWLPDELMLMVLERLSFATLWCGACERVCQRWARLIDSASIMRRKRDGRWAAYEAGVIKPRTLEVHQSRGVHALAIGLDGKVHSGSSDRTITVCMVG